MPLFTDIHFLRIMHLLCRIISEHLEMLLMKLKVKEFCVTQCWWQQIFSAQAKSITFQNGHQPSCRDHYQNYKLYRIWKDTIHLDTEIKLCEGKVIHLIWFVSSTHRFWLGIKYSEWTCECIWSIKNEGELLFIL